MEDILKQLLEYLIPALIGGGGGYFFTRKTKKVELEIKEAEIANLKSDRSKSIMDQYQEALDDLQKRYENRFEYLKEESTRRHEDVRLSFERKVEMIRQEKDSEIEGLNRKINSLSQKLRYWQNKYKERT
jgi:hypothetical protein